jgi:hypothetical protein
MCRITTPVPLCTISDGRASAIAPHSRDPFCRECQVMEQSVNKNSRSAPPELHRPDTTLLCANSAACRVSLELSQRRWSGASALKGLETLKPNELHKLACPCQSNANYQPEEHSAKWVIGHDRRQFMPAKLVSSRLGSSRKDGALRVCNQAPLKEGRRVPTNSSRMTTCRSQRRPPMARNNCLELAFAWVWRPHKRIQTALSVSVSSGEGKLTCAMSQDASLKLHEVLLSPHWIRRKRNAHTAYQDAYCHTSDGTCYALTESITITKPSSVGNVSTETGGREWFR